VAWRREEDGLASKVEDRVRKDMIWTDYEMICVPL